MATLDNSDFTTIKNIVRSDAPSKAAFKAGGLSKDEYKAVFQAAETWFSTGFTSTPTTSFKDALDVEAPGITNAQAKQVGLVWMCWRFKVQP